MGIELTLLGRFHLFVEGRPVDLRNRKAQALLVYLALTGKRHGREKLAALLWGDRFEDQARRSLRQCIFALRKNIGADMIEGEAELRVKAGAYWVDALDLQPDAPYPGDLLPDFRSGEQEFDDWLAAERTRIRAEAAYMYRDHADRLEKDGKPEEALAAAELALSLEPTDERLARLVIAILAGLGRRTEALMRYAAFRDHLKTELGVSPEAATQALEAQIRADDDRMREPNTGPEGGKEHDGFFHWLIGPFEDMGGGEMATFLAKEIPTAIIQHSRSEGWHPAELLVGVHDSDDANTRLKLARKQGGIWLIAGSVRQIGERMRIAITGTDIDSGGIAATNTTIVSEAESFQFLDEVGTILTGMFRARYRNIQRIDTTFVDRLKLLADHPDRFISVAQDFMLQTAYTTISRETLRELEPVADLAISIMPTRSQVHELKGWIHYSHTDLLGAGERFAGLKTAARYLERALTLDNGNAFAVAGLASVSYWLGDFDATDELLGGLKFTLPLHTVIRGNSLILRGETLAGVEILRETIRTAPGLASNSYWYSTLGLGHFLLEDFEAALAAARNAHEFSREYWLGHLVEIAALARLGRLDECPAAIADYHAEYPGATVSELEWLPIADPKAKKQFFDALREAGLPE